MQSEHTESAPAEQSPIVLTLPILRAHLILARFDQNLDAREVWFVPATVGGWRDRIPLGHLPIAAEPVESVVEPLVLYALGWREQ